MNSQTTLKLADLTKEGPKGVTVSRDMDYVTFNCVTPTIIQPSEIHRIKLGVACDVPGGYVLQISTYPELADKAAEVFPALTVIDSKHVGELMLAVRNHGRDPLNLMPGTPVAVGRLVKPETFDIEGFEYEAPKAQPKSKPQKKNPFSFEVT